VLAEVAQTVDEVLILDGGRLRAHRPMSDIASLEDAFLELTGHPTSQERTAHMLKAGKALRN